MKLLLLANPFGVGLVWLVVGLGSAIAQFEGDRGPQEIIRELQRQSPMHFPSIPIELHHRPFPVVLIPRPAIVLPALGRSYALKLFESSGRLQFHTVVNPEIGPQQLELSQEQEERIVSFYVRQCRHVCDGVGDVFEMTPEQREKLDGAASIDAARFMRRLRGKFAGTAEEQESRGLNPRQVRQDANAELTLGVVSPDSLFRKVLATVVTPEQFGQLVRWRARPILDAIDEHARLSLDAQIQPLGGAEPMPDEESQRFVALSNLQQEKLLNLIIDSYRDKNELLELFRSHELTNLLRDITREQLESFLSAPQVAAVLRKKSTFEWERAFHRGPVGDANIGQRVLKVIELQPLRAPAR